MFSIILFITLLIFCLLNASYFHDVATTMQSELLRSFRSDVGSLPLHALSTLPMTILFVTETSLTVNLKYKQSNYVVRY